MNKNYLTVAISTAAELLRHHNYLRRRASYCHRQEVYWLHTHGADSTMEQLWRAEFLDTHGRAAMTLNAYWHMLEHCDGDRTTAHDNCRALVNDGADKANAYNGIAPN